MSQENDIAEISDTLNDIRRALEHIAASLAKIVDKVVEL